MPKPTQVTHLQQQQLDSKIAPDVQVTLAISEAEHPRGLGLALQIDNCLKLTTIGKDSAASDQLSMSCIIFPSLVSETTPRMLHFQRRGPMPH